VGLVFVLLSLVPSHPIERVRVLARRPAIALIAAALPLLLVLTNDESIRIAVGNRATNGRWAENVLVELEYGGASIPDHQRLTQELDYVRAGDYRALVRRIGSPLDHQKPADVPCALSRSLIGCNVPELRVPGCSSRGRGWLRQQSSVAKRPATI
jgi:hypothetical protein